MKNFIKCMTLPHFAILVWATTAILGIVNLYLGNYGIACTSIVSTIVLIATV